MIIRIKNLRIRTVVGVDPEERAAPRDVIVNVEMRVDASGAVESDDLSGTLDYTEVADRIRQFASTNNCALLETLARGILDRVLSDRRVEWASVEVDKPGAIADAESVSVSMSSEGGQWS
jgi:D-erythro-7,8-dihydroneopterin triphosphate epimerase